MTGLTNKQANKQGREDMSADVRDELAFATGLAMGVRHFGTGDPDDVSDERCEPLEAERDAGARAFDPRASFGSEDFHLGYERGYENARLLDALARKGK